MLFEKGENVVNKHFLLSLQFFLCHGKTTLILCMTFDSMSANAFNFEKSKIFSSGKGLRIIGEQETRVSIHYPFFKMFFVFF